ncbi:MAG: AMP-binding protein, partial [Longimicrobiales bacterium]|nr:AMP-binding protein [Longimicrobiales bacterium]
APALVTDGEVLSHRELQDRVGSRAASMRDGDEVGRAGSVVPLVVRPDADGIVDLLAVWRMGRIPAPLNHRLTEPEMVAAKAAMRDASLPSGTQVVLWTSGTSGRPRGVALSWANLEASARAAAERLSLTPDDVWVASLSPAHVGGLALVTRSLILGSALVVPGAHDAATLSALLDGEGASFTPTHLSLVPTQLLRILDHRGDRTAPAELRCVLVGGAHAPESLVRRALDLGWPLALTYGATEMSSQIATAPPEVTRAAPGTVGEPLLGVEVAVDGGGELRARGPTQALGYVGEGAGTLADADGWYATGDLGRIDEHGRLWITGRHIDRIVSGGVTVDAVEVEEALRAHPTVIDACVVGVPDEEWGERVGAWVEPVVGELELEELERHLRERLAPAKLPRIWRTDGALPRNANGKVDRKAVREALKG